MYEDLNHCQICNVCLLKKSFVCDKCYESFDKQLLKELVISKKYPKSIRREIFDEFRKLARRRKRNLTHEVYSILKQSNDDQLKIHIEEGKFIVEM